MRENILDSLRVELKVATQRFANYFKIGRVGYSTSASSYIVYISWRGFHSEVGFIGYETSSDRRLPAGKKIEFSLAYRIHPYLQYCAEVSHKFLMDVWGIKEPEEFLEEIVSFIFFYIFENVFKFRRQGNDAFVFLYFNFTVKRVKGGYKFEVSNVELLNSMAEKLEVKEFAKDILERLAYEIYKKSGFTIDIPIAYNLVLLWATVIVQSLQKLKNLADEGIDFTRWTE